MEKIDLGLTEMDWNGEIRFWPDWNGLKWSKLVLAQLECLRMEKVTFGWNGMAWNGGSWFWPNVFGQVWLFSKSKREKNKNWIVRWLAATRQGEEEKLIDNIALTW
jgi:hypothetical protein